MRQVWGRPGSTTKVGLRSRTTPGEWRIRDLSVTGVYSFCGAGGQKGWVKREGADRVWKYLIETPPLRVLPPHSRTPVCPCSPSHPPSPPSVLDPVTTGTGRPSPCDLHRPVSLRNKKRSLTGGGFLSASPGVVGFPRHSWDTPWNLRLPRVHRVGPGSGRVREPTL